MSKKTIYKITVLGWEKYNPKSKPGHPSIMLSKRFLDDAKIQRLPSGGKLLYLGLLLRRGEVKETFIEASREDLVRLAGGSGQVIHRLMPLLESLQLVSYEKIDPLIELNLKEKKRKEDKGKESSSEVKRPSPDQAEFIVDHESKKLKSDPDANRRVKEAYCEAYFRRYKIEPSMSAKFHTNISQIVSRIGAEDAVKVAKFYLTHNDGFYLKQTHSIGMLLRDCETLRTQMLRGKAITNTDVKNFEKAEGHKNLLEKIERGEI